MSIIDFLNSPFNIGDLTLSNRLIQGPLAGFSCAPFRQRYYRYTPPAYCVSEMISAVDVLQKHQPDSRFLYRAPEEKVLCYQLSGNNPAILAQAAVRVQSLGADLIDLNCGCPKAKIRKKNAGSAHLDDPDNLLAIICVVKNAITIPLTIKVRILGDERDIAMAQAIEKAGADALIVHGRRWVDDYDKACDFAQIAAIKQALTIPVIANGDIADHDSLSQAIAITGCDAYMIGRAGSGNPWLFQQLLTAPDLTVDVSLIERANCFMTHLYGLSQLESEHQAVLQSKSLVRYYFRDRLENQQLQHFYTLNNLALIEAWLYSLAITPNG